MRSFVVQFAAGTDVDANVEAITGLVRRAADDGADLVVVPEAAMHDFGPPDLPLGPVAQPLVGPFTDTLETLAQQTSTTIVAGMFERSDDRERPYNTLVVVDPADGLVASYRKAHLYDSFGYRESDRLTAGAVTPVVVRLHGFRVGLMTCYDLRFPEFARALVDAGADVLAVPAAWVRGPLKEDHWSTLLRARAIENTVYVVAAGQTGRHYVGLSQVVDPMGVALCGLGDEVGATGTTLDAARLAEARERNPSLANRRIRT